MASAKKALEAVKKRKKELSLDETGKVHPFYEWRPFVTMPAQAKFLHTAARLAVFTGGNKIGKSDVLAHRLMYRCVGEDPTRPGFRYKPVKNRVARVWLGCEPKNVRDWLRDMDALVPPGIEKKTYWSRGDERIEFAPTTTYPRGLVFTIKSYGMQRSEWQREIVDEIGLDESPANPELFPEIQQRLLMSGGTLAIAATFTQGIPKWIYELCKGFNDDFKDKDDGPFMWCRASQRENPLIKAEDIEDRKFGMTEDEIQIRIDGNLLLMLGEDFFPKAALRYHWDRCREPELILTFTTRGQAIFEPWTKQRKGWKVWERPIVGASYVIGADPSSGKSKDASSATILNSDTGEVAATFNDNTIEPIDFGFELYQAGAAYNFAVVAPETNHEGSAVLHALREMAYPRIYRRESFGGRMKQLENTFGWHTSGPSKTTACNDLSSALSRGMRGEQGGIYIYDAEAVNELQAFGHLREKRSGSHGLGALSGHDDRVMSLAIAYQATAQAPKGQPMNHVMFVRSYAQSKLDQMNAQIQRDFEERDRERREQYDFGEHFLMQ